MPIKGAHRLPSALSTRPGKFVASVVVAAVTAVCVIVLGQPALAAGPVYPVMNTSETPPDGVWFRDNPAVSGPRLNGYGVYGGDRVELRCYGWGESLGRYQNRLWYYAGNVTRPSAPGRANVGWLNAHYVNDGQNANVAAPGVAACGAPTPTPVPGPSPTPAPVESSAFGPCRAINLIVVPGTFETKSGSSPASAVGMLANVTNSLGLPDDMVHVHYIGYPSSLDYFKSVTQGAQATWSTIKYYADKCKRTNPRFILLGYSQGAQAAGDVAQDIGTRGAPVSSDRLLGTFLLGDPRRDPNFNPTVGMVTKGSPGLVAQITPSGKRGNFGSATGGVVEYCIAHDPICDNNASWTQGLRALAEKVHAGPHKSYDVNYVPGTSQTFTARIRDDVRGRIISLPSF